MGTFHGVDEKIVMQAFRKERMAVGTSNTPNEVIGFIPPSACGAFVHGFEDEFNAVRLAAIGLLHSIV
jgi:hypothetical protein